MRYAVRVDTYNNIYMKLMNSKIKFPKQSTSNLKNNFLTDLFPECLNFRD